MVSPQPHPGDPHEHTIRDGVGKNGGITAIDGPTFLSTIGWDWLPAIRDRRYGDMAEGVSFGEWAGGDERSAGDDGSSVAEGGFGGCCGSGEGGECQRRAQKGVLKGSFGDVSFEQEVEIAPHSSQVVSFDPKSTAALHVANPKLWWPNGYGPQNLYDLHLSFEVDGKVSDSREVSFGIRKFSYAVPDSENLTISVNGVRVFVRGGNWGLDEGDEAQSAGAAGGADSDASSWRI